ncbi:hypothetical protein apy_02860 [Aeropyrum pernix]|uniref:Uncharacterized protein n=1 Tax=Aeropyrum pernix TaxID=56636 RepID=A0A401H817_AERPX|nr:hypothetical protein [Aeropyrum pernix]GBF08561.1 hypothetical protein apy_02860 [Aeropyrum pernix]
MKANVAAAGVVGAALALASALATGLTGFNPGFGGLDPELAVGLIGIALCVAAAVALYPLYARLSGGSVSGVVESFLSQIMVYLVLWPALHASIRLLLSLGG